MPLQMWGWLRVGVAVTLMLVILAVPALAQPAEDSGPWYDVPVLEPSKPWLQWIFAGVFAALCLALALKNPHRTHLD